MNNPFPFIVLLLLALVVRVSAAQELHWFVDLDEARAVAAKADRPLLVDFTGSTWCPPCIALHDEVLTSPEFAAFAKDFVLVRLDYPRASQRTPEKIAANPALGKLMALKIRYNVPGYPTVLFLDAQGNAHGHMVGYEPGLGPVVYLQRLAAVGKK